MDKDRFDSLMELNDGWAKEQIWKAVQTGNKAKARSEYWDGVSRWWGDWWGGVLIGFLVSAFVVIAIISVTEESRNEKLQLEKCLRGDMATCLKYMADSTDTEGKQAASIKIEQIINEKKEGK